MKVKIKMSNTVIQQHRPNKIIVNLVKNTVNDLMAIGQRKVIFKIIKIIKLK